MIEWRTLSVVINGVIFKWKDEEGTVVWSEIGRFCKYFYKYLLPGWLTLLAPLRLTGRTAQCPRSEQNRYFHDDLISEILSLTDWAYFQTGAPLSQAPSGLDWRREGQNETLWPVERCLSSEVREGVGE